MKVSIIIPVFNESNTIKKVLERVKKVKLVDIEKQIIVVDDGSYDGTTDILKSFKNDDIKLLLLERNMGKASAVREGLKHATGDIVIIQDADLELDPEDYPKLIAPIKQNTVDIVYGSRFLNGWPEMPFYSKLANAIMTTAVNIIYGMKITDGTCGYKVAKLELLKSLNLHSKRFTLEAEIISKVKKRSLKFCEIPVSFSRRKFSEGKKAKYWDAFEWIWELIKNRFRK